ncbi:hypothetical protein HF1_13920 [Mycoplasma haemofelis str. Langford 1]|uniref:Uncharacterized protein n=1 Tax=Mycoplasma haemofelis (strain Langford 1) TaxID=941640 RepID=E8ZJS9_MYCHL|nr:hypothetical protein [Mycoplasma haemofelis]CBY93400.1 hypothetical protein HF1_13920 [Mycoplasma haemofelis str. Langford 1]
MNLLYKGAITTGIIGTGGVGTYYGIQALGTTKVKDQLKNRLLSTIGTTNQSQWEARLASLREDKVKKEDLTSELQEIKDKSKNKTWESLRDWCSSKVEESYEGEDLKFKEIVSYCTFRNKDKFKGTVISETTVSTKWTKANGIITGKSEGLSPTLQAIKKKLEASSGKDTSALKKWCEETYETPWTTNEDPNFQDAQQYCLDDSSLTS